MELNESIKEKMKEGIVASSRIKYMKTGQKFKVFCDENNAVLDENSFLNWLNSVEEKMPPQSLRSAFSHIKWYMKHEQNDDTAEHWGRVNDYLAAVEKQSNHVPRHSKGLTGEDRKQMPNVLKMEGKDLLMQVDETV